MDACFGHLSQRVYGRHSRGDARIDMLDFEALEATIRSTFGPRLKAYEHVQGCFNFDEFVEGYRPSSEESTLNISRFHPSQP